MQDLQTQKSVFDPLTGQIEEVYPAVKCNHCPAKISPAQTVRFEGCCENCYDAGNYHDLQASLMQEQY